MRENRLSGTGDDNALDADILFDLALCLVSRGARRIRPYSYANSITLFQLDILEHYREATLFQLLLESTNI